MLRGGREEEVVVHKEKLESEEMLALVEKEWQVLRGREGKGEVVLMKRSCVKKE